MLLLTYGVVYDYDDLSLKNLLYNKKISEMLKADV